MITARTRQELLAELGRLRVRAARGTGRAQVSLRDLARATGVPRSSLSQYLNGQALMPGDVLDAVVLALGATPAEAREWAEAWEHVTAETLRPAVPAAQPAPATPSRPPVRLLPADVAAFTGRAGTLSELDGVLAAGTGSAVVITAIAGTAGVGKTALAVHWAHRVAGQFEDGQLYLNLRGYDPGQLVTATAALERLLRTLGIEAIPPDLDGRSDLFRSTLAGRRMLLVLDNARSADQIRPLLPGTPEVLVLVTSRDDMAGLVARDGARRIALDRLSEAEAVSLLRQLLGADRVLGEPEAIASLVRLCSGLPLALRIAAERVARLGDLPVAELVAELRGEGLDGLDAGGGPLTDLRAVFSWSHRALPAPAARLFVLLGVVPGQDFDVEAASRAAGVTFAEARSLLSTLARAHLVEGTVPGRYAMHDLLAEYAAELVAGQPHEAEEATTRLFGWYLAQARAAVSLVRPDGLCLDDGRADSEPVSPMDTASALAWLRTEEDNLVAVARRAIERGRPEIAWLLLDAMRNCMAVSGRHDEWLAVAETSLTAAAAADEAPAQVAILLAMTHLRLMRGEFPAALRHCEVALPLAESSAMPAYEAVIHSAMGGAYITMGELGVATEHYVAALAINRRSGPREMLPLHLANLGRARGQAGDLAGAAGYLTEAAALFTELGSDIGLAVTVHNLCNVHLMLGQLDQAREHAVRGVAIQRRLGDPANLADSLHLLALVDTRRGDTGQAWLAAHEAVTLVQGDVDPLAEAMCRSIIGGVHLGRGELGDALREYQLALDLARQIQAHLAEANALSGLAKVHRDLGQHDAALGWVTQAIACARAAGEPVDGDFAILASIHNARGEHDEATGYAEQAVAAGRSQNKPLTIADGLIELGVAIVAKDVGAAGAHWREAHAILTEAGSPEASRVLALLTAHNPGLA
ncbi:ATP-binding protein [Longispora albida]|uniref:ATP-binding protein n=1 Tax=Longispora albida TaxID=203523 RepID=UPI00037B70FF|nr:tetratricopeptide repeat protein [Longispora albida]